MLLFVLLRNAASSGGGDADGAAAGGGFCSSLSGHLVSMILQPESPESTKHTPVSRKLPRSLTIR